MKVILFNGSRRENGCTYTALNIVANQLKAAGIETKIVFVGGRVLKGEVNEVVHEAKELLETADGVVYGSPVYYASPSCCSSRQQTWFPHAVQGRPQLSMCSISTRPMRNSRS